MGVCGRLLLPRAGAVGAITPDFDRRLFRLEVLRLLPLQKAACYQLVVEFGDLSAVFADGKGSHAVNVILDRVRAGDESIQAFEAVDLAEFQKLVQGPVDLERRTDTIVA